MRRFADAAVAPIYLPPGQSFFSYEPDNVVMVLGSCVTLVSWDDATGARNVTAGRAFLAENGIPLIDHQVHRCNGLRVSVGTSDGTATVMPLRGCDAVG